MDRRGFVRSAASGAASLALGARGAEREAAAGAPADGRAMLDSVESIGWGRTACLCYVGSVAATMRYLGEEVTDDYLMGVSGGAFKILWGMPWSDCNCDILIMGDEPIERTFAALGYDYTRYPDYDHRNPGNTKALWRAQIVASIDDRRPVVMQGPVGPPECSVIVGYDRGGDVLYGWSYFQENHSEHFRSDDWFERSIGLIIVREKHAEPSPREVLLGTLEWAIELARVPQIDWPGPGPLMCGLAAYDAFSDALERDEDFPPDDPEVLRERLYAIANDGAYLMQCKRPAAARFLDGLADSGFPCPVELLQAADAYRNVGDIWKHVATMVPGTGAPEEKRREIADPDLRRKVAHLVREARAHEEAAVEYIEQAYTVLLDEDA